MNKKELAPNKELAAVCGLFCTACQSYLDTQEHPERIAEMAEKAGRPTEDFRCLGCRSGTLNFFCREHCYMKSCAERKNVDFCVECDEFPCAELKKFQALAPHRIELWKNHARIAEVGYEAWYAEMLDLYSCPQCGTVNSAYDISCRGCGKEPSCTYVEKYKDEIVTFDKEKAEIALANEEH